MLYEQFIRRPDGETDPVEPFQITQPGRKQRRLWRHLLLAAVIVVVGAATSSAATLFVDSTADVFHGGCNPGNCTIKDAIFVAQTNGAPSNTIVLQNCAFYLVTSPYLTSNNAFPAITTVMTIIGNAATIERASNAPPFRFLEVAPFGDLTMENLTLQGGYAPSDGGGAIVNFSKLTLRNCILENNTGGNAGGAILSLSGVFSNQGAVAVNIDGCTLRNNSAQNGGGLASVSQSPPSIPPIKVITETITRSSFVNNHATAGWGGGMYLAYAHNLTIRDTTISGNTAAQGGGGLMLATLAKQDANGVILAISLRNLTVTNNSAAQNAGGIFDSICGLPDCPIPAQVPITNSIVANNTAPSNANYEVNGHGLLVSGGHNIVGPGNGFFSSLGTDHLLPGALPALGPLTTTGDAGGEHHRPLNGCIAISAGDPSLCSPSDQLELPRVGLPAVCDIGAVEHRYCVQPPGGMQAWWQFEETISPARDHTGNPANKGIWVGGPTPSPGMVGTALAFNGVNQFVTVGSNVSINFTNLCDAITIDAWIKTCASGLQVFVDKRVVTSFGFVQGYELFVFNGRLGFQMANGHTFVNYVAPVSSPNLSDNRWHFVAVTVSQCPSAGKLFVDGNPLPGFLPLGGSMANSANLLVGGGYNPGGQPYSFNGSIDELEIFKKKLKDTDILALYQAGWAGKCLCGGNPSNCRLIPQDATPSRSQVALLSTPRFLDVARLEH